jgi:hypothetical protein
MDSLPDILAQEAEYVAAKGATELSEKAPYDSRLRGQRTIGIAFGAEAEAQDTWADDLREGPSWTTRQKPTGADL